MINFYQHTQAWIDGELLEGALLCAFGIATMIGAVLFWKLGTMPSAKALLWLLLLGGMIYTAVGVSLRVSNQKRAVEYPALYQERGEAFVEAERERVESFQYQYVISKVVATVCFIATLLIFWLSTSPVWQGIGIGLGYFGLVGLVVDYFSQDRAQIYYEAIMQALGHT